MESLSSLSDHIPGVYEKIELQEEQRDYLLMEHVEGFPLSYFFDPKVNNILIVKKVSFLAQKTYYKSFLLKRVKI